jgi:topoisomerase IV subunit A
MAYVKKLFNENFLQYASYVIKDRAIPDIEDGLKPVQRRILHSLFEMDDGKFHKVANVVGHCMKYHPHGDASIYSALVVLANKELFIDKQGNFGNLFTGDEASAARYIECRTNALAKDVLYRPEITEFAPSYDGRNSEPKTFPAKIPLLLCIGAEGIAVGMSTRVLPHNLAEVLRAEIACLRGKRFQLYPDFPTGGLMDVAGYEDGNGKILLRARIDSSDPKRILITEVPAGSSTESLISSVENAARAGRIKIASIQDFTTDKVEIEIKLARGVYAEETIDALYAFTDCEQSISCNFLVIKDGQPVLMSVTEALEYHAGRLVDILKKGLKIDRKELEDRLHARTLERIFVEERIYKAIEQMKTEATVKSAVLKGLKPFSQEIKREVTEEDLERLLKIPIRRISLYDINRARAEMEEIKAKIKEIDRNLKGIVDYAVSYLEGVLKRTEACQGRKTDIVQFHKVDVKGAALRNLSLRYDPNTGYLGTAVSSGQEMLQVSSFDRVLVIRRTGVYTVTDAPEKLFVDKGLKFAGLAEKDILSSIVFTLVYRDPDTGYPCIKRCKIEAFILNKDYLLIPDGGEVLALGMGDHYKFVVNYVEKPRIKKRAEEFRAKDFLVKGLKANGVRLAPREVESVTPVEEGGQRSLPLEGRVAKGKNPETEAGAKGAKAAEKTAGGKSAKGAVKKANTKSTAKAKAGKGKGGKARA